MPKKPTDKNKMRPDVAETAFRTMMEATGQASKTDPANREKNPEAVSRGLKGGAKGGKARARSLTPAKRGKIAQQGAKARWARKSPPTTE